MVNARHFDRISANIADAEKRKLRTVTINPADEDFADNPTRKIAPTLIINPDDDAMCMQDEIFGPILPIKTYKNFEDTISYINAHPRPWRPIISVKTKRKKNASCKAQPRVVCRSMMSCSTCCKRTCRLAALGPAAWVPITGLKGSKLLVTQKASIANRGVFRLPNLPDLCRPMGLRPKKASDRKLKNEPCTSPGPHTGPEAFSASANFGCSENAF